MLTAVKLRELLDYDLETGVFTWRVRRGSAAAGREAGTVAQCGPYRQINISRTYYRAHRLAWLWMTGEWPSGLIDHIDGDGLNNRWCNLREASPTQNNANRKIAPGRRTGLKGVSTEKNRKKAYYRARIMVGGVQHHLGIFSSAEEAHAAYCAAAARYFGEFARSA